MALTQTLLPEPVAPAMRTCGILREVGAERLAGDVLAEREGEAALRGEVVEVVARQHLLERDEVERDVRDLDPDVAARRGSAPGCGCERAASARARLSASPSIRDELDPRLDVQGVLRDDRPLLDAGHLHADPEVARASRGCAGPWRVRSIWAAPTRARRRGRRARAGPRSAAVSSSAASASTATGGSAPARCARSSTSRSAVAAASPPRSPTGIAAGGGGTTGRARRPSGRPFVSGRWRRTMSGGSSSLASLPPASAPRMRSMQPGPRLRLRLGRRLAGGAPARRRRVARQPRPARGARRAPGAMRRRCRRSSC